jgi:hypothetical protein
MTIPIFDPYGEEYGDWEDPYSHVFLTMCTGCPMCVAWEGKPYDQIRAERVDLTVRRRSRRVLEPTAREIAAEDRAYWNQ